LAGAVIAVRTVEALLPSVHEEVLRQIALFAGAVIAVCAVEALLPSVHEQVCRQAALVSGFEIAVFANVLHPHLAVCVTATGSIKQSRADRQHGCPHEETKPTGLTEPTDRARCPGARVEDIERPLTIKKMSRPRNVHSVAHGRLSTCTVTAAAPLWSLAAVAMQLLDVMTCKRCVCCDAEDTRSLYRVVCFTSFRRFHQNQTNSLTTFFRMKAGQNLQTVGRGNRVEKKTPAAMVSLPPRD
jgi:hypothetical protein